MYRRQNQQCHEQELKLVLPSRHVSAWQKLPEECQVNQRHCHLDTEAICTVLPLSCASLLQVVNHNMGESPGPILLARARLLWWSEKLGCVKVLCPSILLAATTHGTLLCSYPPWASKTSAGARDWRPHVFHLLDCHLHCVYDKQGFM